MLLRRRFAFAVSSLLAASSCSSSDGTGAPPDAGGATEGGGPGADSGPAPDSGGDGGGKDSGSPPVDAGKEAGTPQPNDVIIDPGKPHQTMDGFGGSDAWAGVPFTTAQADLLFDANKGIGLSILRVGIGSDGKFMGGAEGANAKLAAARGAIVWGAPWQPPAADKLGANGQGFAGSINPADYDAWANVLAGFAQTMQGQGVPLYGVSAQNEPDFPASTYASCIYSAAQMVDFIKVLGPKLAAMNPRPKLIAPEPEDWNDLWGGPNDFGSAILADATAASNVDVFATHDYGHQPLAHAGLTKPLWETEVSGIGGTGNCDAVCVGPNTTIDNGILVAHWVYDAIVTAGVSAWHYWWLIPANDSSNQGLLTSTGGTTKRLYTVGNFSKFVRPGYVRVDVSGSVPPGVRVVAFQNPPDATVVVVAINTNAAATALPLFVGGASWPGQVTPWATSVTDDLASGSPVTVTAARFTGMLPARSVTTFVGRP